MSQGDKGSAPGEDIELIIIIKPFLSFVKGISTVF